MNKNVSEKLKVWASNNNWKSSRPVNDECFWDFVIEAFKNGDYFISEEDFYGILVKYHNDEDVLTDLYFKYKNGIELLKQFTGKAI